MPFGPVVGRPERRLEEGDFGPVAVGDDGGHDGRVSTPVQALTADDALAQLGSSRRGLDAGEAAARLSRDGRNTLPSPRHQRLWIRFAAQFTDLFAIVLIVAAAVTLVAYGLELPRDAGKLELAVAIVCVVVLNAAIGFAQEYSAERTAAALQAMVPNACVVLRGGVRQQVPVAELVPGDLVVLDPGDAVPADCRLVEAHALAVNTAALTGESAPVSRVADPAAPDAGKLEARNLLFMGTAVTAGSGKAVVVSTGGNTEFGRIFRLTMQAPTQQSPLQRQVAVMARRVSAVALAVGGIIFAVRLPTGQPVVESFIFALGVMVALVPEGLPATLSVSLAVGVRRMARYHALVKRLLAVEALGSTAVICTDKTGTLTQAEMTVTQVWAAGVSHSVSGVGYEPRGSVENAPQVRDLLRMAALCSNARLLPPDNAHGWRVLGDTTEGALLVAAAKAGVDVSRAEQESPRVTEFPFDSTRKLMSTVHRADTRHRSYAVYTKGAPAELLARCSRWLGPSGLQPLDGCAQRAILAANDEMAGPGLRVLAVAYRTVMLAEPAQHDAEIELTFAGLVGMLDPPRAEVSEAVHACHGAGIRIVMVTGDHALTAEAVARRLGIIGRRPFRAVTGTQLDGLTDSALGGLLAAADDVLFCRVNPEHKMRVVHALQASGHVVAVTGDGANDAPALKAADIGVAMGRNGTDVAREAAVMVLLNDSFAAIVAAVRLGRSVYQNIRKFLIYCFTSNVAELVPILVATAIGFPLVPLTAVQVLTIDLGSDVLPALALGAEPPESDVMDRPPRSRRETVLSGAVLRRILFLGGIQAVGVSLVFFWRIHSARIGFADFTASNATYREAITVSHAAIVMGQLFTSLAVRSDRHSIRRVGLFANRRLLAAQTLALAFVVAVSYVPALQRLFNTAALSPTDWLMVTAVGVAVLACDETRKSLLHRRERHRSPHRSVGDSPQPSTPQLTGGEVT